MRLRKTTLQWIIVIVLLIVVLSGGFFIAYYYTINRYRASYENTLNEKDAFIESQQRTAYVAYKDLKAGDRLTDENVECQTVFSMQEQFEFMDASYLNNTVLVDVPAGMYITKNIVTEYKEEQENYRELHYSEFMVTPNIDAQDYCDLRIAYPNGETYVVLSKKRLVDIGVNKQDCILWMSPEEIDRMQSSIVDTFLYGAELFLTKYIAPTFQEESIVTYTPSKQIIELINKDPNIIQIASDFLSNRVRLELENRMYDSLQNENIKNWTEDEIKEISDVEQEQPVSLSDDYFSD